MKTINIWVAIIIAATATLSVNAQSDKTERTIGVKTQKIKVHGECGMCKKRIEKAAVAIEGIRSASWSEDTKTLTIKYNTFRKEAVENVQKRMAAIGYDTEKYRADDAIYEKLPDCCQYVRKGS